MRLNYKFSVLSFLLIISIQSQAQDAYLNESKYWFYRYRLLTEFLVQGETACGNGSGLTIPCGSAYLRSNQKDENEINFDVKHNFGDGTSFLGYYIAVLATEHKLFQNNNAPQWQKDEVKKELYFAMKAFERLDKNAESIINSVKLDRSCNENANGFFMRDDVPASAEDPYLARDFNNGFRYRDDNGNRLNREITSDYGSQKHAAIEQLSGKSKDDNVKHPFISLDQCVDLMVGFSLVTKFMDNESWNGFNFKYYARESTNRILTYLKSNNYFIPIPGQEGKCYQEIDVNDWLNALIRDFPTIGGDVNFNPGYHTNCLVKYGGLETRASAYSIAQAGNMIYNDFLSAESLFRGLCDLKAKKLT